MQIKMASYNNITIVGNVGKKPETREVNGKKVVSFSVATTFGYGTNSVTDWHNVTAWEKKAELIEKFVGVGSTILVSGPMRYRSYKRNDGVEVRVAEILANDVQLLGSKNEGKETPAAAPAAAPAPAAETTDPDLPF